METWGKQGRFWTGLPRALPGRVGWGNGGHGTSENGVAYCTASPRIRLPTLPTSQYLQVLIAWPPQVGCDVCCSAQARLTGY